MILIIKLRATNINGLKFQDVTLITADLDEIINALINEFRRDLALIINTTKTSTH